MNGDQHRAGSTSASLTMRASLPSPPRQSFLRGRPAGNPRWAWRRRQRGPCGGLGSTGRVWKGVLHSLQTCSRAHPLKFTATPIWEPPQNSPARLGSGPPEAPRWAWPRRRRPRSRSPRALARGSRRACGRRGRRTAPGRCRRRRGPPRGPGPRRGRRTRRKPAGPGRCGGRSRPAAAGTEPRAACNADRAGRNSGPVRGRTSRPVRPLRLWRHPCSEPGTRSPRACTPSCARCPRAS